MTPEQQQFLDAYLDTLPLEKRTSPPKAIAEYFCADEYNANECARLINIGKKRASCSLKSAYDIDQEPLPQVGQLTVVLNWQQQPVCIVQLTEVSLCPFNQVTREFAESEGEGDGSYEWWHQAHVNFFTKYAKSIGTVFTETDELVLERFEKVYPL
ncbi:ASCH domain-containing protein [Vibrio sp. T187]|uniref:ASCH domain-containing protein n=1 Tax=Vibrio TaxID=662 RepID=UPI0010C96908|nr:MULTISPECIES: ASCH domain-containing protein [Vibrio]MBW3695396.1 ASCH domain-containing protein [Vibrio sp. T187]